MIYSVVEFTGFRIKPQSLSGWGGKDRGVTDLHVVDERGRTRAVFAPAGNGLPPLWVRRMRAQELADRLNRGEEVV